MDNIALVLHTMSPLQSYLLFLSTIAVNIATYRVGSYGMLDRLNRTDDMSCVYIRNGDAVLNPLCQRFCIVKGRTRCRRLNRAASKDLARI